MKNCLSTGKFCGETFSMFDSQFLKKWKSIKKRKYRAAEISTVLLNLDCHSQWYQSGRFDIRSWKNINSVLEHLIFFSCKNCHRLGVFLVMTKITFLRVEPDFSMNTDSWISTVPRGSERSEWASPWTERCRASERSERSERFERTNVASDRVTR